MECSAPKYSLTAIENSRAGALGLNVQTRDCFYTRMGREILYGGAARRATMRTGTPPKMLTRSDQHRRGIVILQEGHGRFASFELAAIGQHHQESRALQRPCWPAIKPAPQSFQINRPDPFSS